MNVQTPVAAVMSNQTTLVGRVVKDELVKNLRGEGKGGGGGGGV